VYDHLCQAVVGLTTTEELPHLKAQIDQLIEAGDKHRNVVEGLIKLLFPGAEQHIGGSHYSSDWKNRWLQERRVAHQDILHLYLERVIGAGLQAFTDAEQAWARMADRSALDSYLRSLDVERLEDVISSLEALENEFASHPVVPGTIVLLNLLPELPERQRGMFELDPRIAVRRVVYRLLRSLQTPDKVGAAVREILPELTTLSAKFELLTIVGYREHAGRQLVSELAARQLEKDWRAEVRAASVDALAKEPELFRILLFAIRDADPTEPPLKIVDVPQITLALLKSARSEVLRQGIESRAVRRSTRLSWDGLIELFGNENTLRERIEHLKATQPKGVDELLRLADRYLGGWRPRDFDDD
jgi:hypothetical protein